MRSSNAPYLMGLHSLPAAQTFYTHKGGAKPETLHRQRNTKYCYSFPTSEGWKPESSWGMELNL